MSSHESRIFRYIFESGQGRSGMRNLLPGGGATIDYHMSQNEFEANVETALEQEPKDKDADVAEMLEEFLEPETRDSLFAHFQSLRVTADRNV